MLNHFHIPIEDSIHAEVFLHSIREKIDTHNLLHVVNVERKRLNARRDDFERLEANQIQNFPQLTEEQVVLPFLGTYQMKLIRSSCSENLRNGLYKRVIEVYRENALGDCEI